ncbi:MAG: DUF4837 family protein [Saonia sp.]
MKLLGTLFIAVLLITISCKDENQKNYRPASIGAINSLAVVMDNDLWEGPVGDKVREHFAAPILGLSWDEPLFTINHMPGKVFSGTVRNTRSVLVVDQDSLSISHIKKDVYAGPQRIAVIRGRTEEEIIQNIETKADEIIASFKNLEINETQKRFMKSLNKEKALEEKFNISLTLPSVYRVGKQEDNFVWIDRQIPKGNMNIIAYVMPWDSFTKDSTFVRDIVEMRDSIGQKYIPGPNPGTYMMTEKAFAPYVFSSEIGGKKAAEIKGIWEINGYPMAGPFITYIINDKENNRKLVLEGFAFAPATEKREYMFELEAILKTVKFEKALSQ